MTLTFDLRLPKSNEVIFEFKSLLNLKIFPQANLKILRSRKWDRRTDNPKTLFYLPLGVAGAGL